MAASPGCPRGKGIRSQKRILSRFSSSDAKDQEIIYLGTMAKLKARPRGQSPKDHHLTSLKDSRRDCRLPERH